MLFVDGGNDRVGIGKTSATYNFEVNGGTSNTVASFESTDATARIVFKDNSGEAFVGGTGDAVTFYTSSSATERARIDSSGRLLVGSSSTREVGYGDNASLQLEGTSYPKAAISLILNSNNANGPSINLAKSRGTSNGTSTVVQNNDILGLIAFSGGDGTDIRTMGARIQASVDGTPGANDMPGRLTFSTTADGASSPTERLRLDSSGNVGIGATSVPTNFQVEIAKSGSVGLNLRNTNNSASDSGRIAFSQGSGNLASANTFADIIASADTVSPLTGSIKFRTNQGNSLDEAMRLDSSGNLLVGNTTATGFVSSSSQTGVIAFQSGALAVNKSDDDVASFNRLTSNGTIVSLRQAGTQEGEIRVSGTTVSYLGGHLSRWSQTLTLEEHSNLLKGTVMTNLDEMCEWENEDNEQLNKMAISTTEGDPNVAGVIVGIDEDNDLNVGMTGDMVIRIAQGTTVARGDLLMSAGDGTAKPQDDDIVRSKTIAKVTSTTVSTTYSDNSYCVPCVLMAC